ncbi:hypothetical protein, partial [Pseudothermotoga sp.]
PINNGIFSVDLDVSQNHFNGQALWIQVEIGGTKMACQEILPAPYALSLVPGARIFDADSEIYVNRALPLALLPPRWAKYGIYGKADGSNADTTYYGVYGNGKHYGVYGYSDSGTAVYAKSDSGVAIRAAGTGVIESNALTDWVVSPLKIVRESTNFTIAASADGYVILTPTASGTGYADLPVDVVSSLFGSRIYFRRYYFNYKTDTLSDKIKSVSVRQTNADGTSTFFCTYSSELTSTTWAEESCIADSPIYGPIYIRFELSFAGSGTSHDILLGKMWIQLGE